MSHAKRDLAFEKLLQISQTFKTKSSLAQLTYLPFKSMVGKAKAQCRLRQASNVRFKKAGKEEELRRPQRTQENSGQRILSF